MLFNSIEFVIFLPLVLILYWGIFNKGSVNLRNAFLLVAAYVFYGWWDYRFLGLIALSSLFDFFCGKYIYEAKAEKIKRIFLFISLAVNLSILFFFKYFGFFATQLTELFRQFGFTAHPITLKIILPVGVSFYTFQALSYTIDIYRGRMKPTNNALAFFTFISFFPQLVAGPIERARNLLPQFSSLKKFDYPKAANGFRQLLWGFFAKIAVADSIAPITDSIFANNGSLGAGTLVFGAVLFSVQLFCDFAGYSNIAIGIASILGFDIMRNFNLPFFSRSISEFWTRWHISLSTWFREYVYFPLGGNQCSKARYYFNIMVTFLISGLWHGANWTFVVWGMIHGIFYLITKPFSPKDNSGELSLRQWPSMVGNFLLVCAAFVFFRAENLAQALDFFSRIFHLSGGTNVFQLFEPTKIFIAVFFSSVLFVAEWIQRDKKHAMDIAEATPFVRHSIYYILIFVILFAFQTDRIFIYFQF
jgi:alginate O-acetyltransferase complex protein AlgI